jgi:hypothetical protein
VIHELKNMGAEVFFRYLRTIIVQKDFMKNPGFGKATNT